MLVSSATSLKFLPTTTVTPLSGPAGTSSLLRKGLSLPAKKESAKPLSDLTSSTLPSKLNFFMGSPSGMETSTAVGICSLVTPK